MPRQSPAEIAAVINGIVAQNLRHLVIQLDRPVDGELRHRLESVGVSLLDYLGSHAFFAALRPERLDINVLSGMEALANAQTIDRTHKLHPLLTRGTAALGCDGRGTAASAVAPVPPATAEAAVPHDNPITAAYVKFHRDVALTTEAAPTCLQHGATIRSQLRTVNGLVIELPHAEIQPLANHDAVQWIEPALPPLTATNNSNRELTQADQVQTAPYDLDGTGVTVMVYDVGSVDPNHPDFAGRLTPGDDASPSSHSTHVAGTVGGNGAASDSLYRGMAPNVDIVSYAFGADATGLPLYTDPGDIENDYRQAINLHNIDLATNSIGTNTCRNGFNCEITGDYGVTSSVIDAIIHGDLGQPLIVLFANGNERSCQRCRDEGVHTPEGYHSTAPPACAKNHIAVGAVNSDDDSITFFTSWGPTDDGRLKPDIVAPGCQLTDDNGVTSCDVGGDYTTYCGTSMATPTVAGLAALLLQDLSQQGGTGFQPLNSTIKILLAHNA
ncbi:MAG: S8 family serine peptidase, partial [Planctomycetes bacterium]|nr:S8 family serine peptidase [Planctomycetota bacterium]